MKRASRGRWRAAAGVALCVALAPALLGGDDGVPMFAGPGAPTMADVWRGALDAVTRLGPDVRLDVVADGSFGPSGR